MDVNQLLSDAEEAKVPDEGELRDIGSIAKRALALDSEIKAMNEQLSKLEKEYRDIVEKELPEAMDGANCSEFKTPEGKKIKIKDDVRASISKDNKPEAHAWLREHEHGDLIKNEIVVPLSRGLDNVATDIINDIKSKYGIDAERSESVHASTLSAFCREQMGNGVELPAGLLGLYVRRVAVIK